MVPERTARRVHRFRGPPIWEEGFTRMHIHRSARGLVVQAPAKLNLFLEVLAKRNDGYHEIATLMCPIDLYDTLHFQEDTNGRV